MIELLFGILISLLVPLAVCIYYAMDDIKNVDGLFGKIKRISIRNKKEYYVLVASFIGALFAFAMSHYVFKHSDIFWTYRWQIAMATVVPIAVIDWKEKIIPNKLLLIGTAFTLLTIGVQIAFNASYIISILGNSFIGLIAGGGVFFFASLFVKNGIGAGDIKMFLWLGFLLAFRGIFNVLLYSMVISAIYSIVLLISKKKTTKDELPLAPFTLIGIVVSVLFGV